jgi:signal transduction histidine kinase
LKSESQESPEALLANNPALQAEFDREDLGERLRLGKVGAGLVVVLMPAGITLDLVVYPNWVWPFLGIRLICSLLAGMLLLAHYTAFGSRHVRLLSNFVALLPAASIAVMIGLTEGWNSPYYAGLNLVLLAANVVVHWTLRESLVVSGIILSFYVAACLVNGQPPRTGSDYNSLYFVVLTAAIVATGNYFFNTLRRREFVAREELKRSERELEQSNSELKASQLDLEQSNGELKLREQQLEQSNVKLRELDELKGHFFANISHELRTPLTLLIAPLETLRSHPSLLAEPGVRDQLQTMHANGMRLLKLINDLLELVRLDSHALKLRRVAVSLPEFLKGLLDAIRGLTQEKGIRLSCFVAPTATHILGDPDRLEKVFLNLLFNAVKFTPSGGEISVRAEPDGDFAVIAVRDTGMGINPEQLPFVFDRFWQADSTTRRKFQGAGIGLALVKELVEAHGGTVLAQSAPGEGTVMNVRLPLAKPEEVEAARLAADPASAPSSAGSDTAAPAPPDRDAWLEGLYRRAELFVGVAPLRDSLRPWTPNGAGPRRPRLLLTDDEPDMLRFLKSQLSDDYEVIEAVDGLEAVSLATQLLPDVIVCDMMMPEKDGMTVCRELRAQTSTQSLPFLMLTARADDETKLQALAAGASDFLPKPFSSAELRLRLKNLVDAHQLQKALAWQNKKLEAALEQVKETEMQLVQTEKLASLGRLSAGIIHEINNPLNYALTALHIIRKDAKLLPDSAQEGFREAATDMEDGLKRVVAIVSDLRSFTHNHAGPAQSMKLAVVVEKALRLFAAELHDQVSLNVEVPANLEVLANPNRLLQVLINVIQNSIDAMKSRNGSGPAAELWFEAGRRDEVPFLIIRDNGPGIAPEHLPKIFDPFFTTKDVGSGMGLGLSISHRIMEEAGGRIRIESRPGEFCQVTLEFARAPVS